MARESRKPALAMLAAPLTALILAGMSVYSLVSIRPSGSDAYFANVRTAIEALPDQIDSYIGEDRPALAAAVELLRPNKLLQREYKDPLTGSRFSILVVHCGDVRDMMGHYPPVCYPSNGWDVDSVNGEHIDRSVGGPIPITRYHVSRGDGEARVSRVIANTFVVPRADDPLGRDDRALDRVTRTRWSSGLGAAQVQIITNAQMDPATRERIERSVADELEGLIGAIARGREGEGEST
ncbi:MAG: EpsI family protein [Phycisphaera sp.]|nr:MAG: EpsI family protein [Phycisphaera sp.]